MTMCEAAEVLRLSARTVREYARRGEIWGESLENGGHYDVQTLTPSSKTQAETGMDLRTLVLMRSISRLKIKLVPLWEVKRLVRGDPIPLGRIVGFSYICLTYQSPSCPFLNFHSLLLTFGGGFPNRMCCELQKTDLR